MLRVWDFILCNQVENRLVSTFPASFVFSLVRCCRRVGVVRYANFCVVSASATLVRKVHHFFEHGSFKEDIYSGCCAQPSIITFSYKQERKELALRARPLVYRQPQPIAYLNDINCWFPLMRNHSTIPQSQWDVLNAPYRCVQMALVVDDVMMYHVSSDKHHVYMDTK